MPFPKDFDLARRPLFDSSAKWAAFWTSFSPWFKEKGYLLHLPGCQFPDLDISDGLTLPVCETFHRLQQFPYAVADSTDVPQTIFNRGSKEVEVPPFIATFNTGRVFAAQDTRGRHVCIKLVKAKSNELEVINLLRTQPSTPGVLPILDVIAYDTDYVFMVMPRYGDIPGPSDLFRTAGEVSDFVIDALQGLRTLHQLRIAHRDMKINNMVLNHLFYVPARSKGYLRPFTEMRGPVTHQIQFAIIDFDFSMIVPAGTSLLPSELAWMREYSAMDVAQGELYYDPFAYDVGVLGVAFCGILQHLTPYIPALAPLLDGMVDHDVRKRFTARNAHDFAVRHLRDMLSPEELAIRIDHIPNKSIPWNEYNRWEGVPKHVSQWSDYRLAPLPVWKQILRRVCENKKGLAQVRAMRKSMQVVGLPAS
ncbi:hypothetical protein D9758_001513 [Tetrapyrgos nigripes]|uniref:Protein kinase domain-containing protein n=1 Tax=Tetrapyrgos nigripes TaxID=182062 RepID=A0A8H5GY98_9AGAR|nr:hypothetical protein D9758_001513 [Tetrapyrgos nigripes]